MAIENRALRLLMAMTLGILAEMAKGPVDSGRLAVCGDGVCILL